MKREKLIKVSMRPIWKRSLSKNMSLKRLNEAFSVKRKKASYAW